MGSKGAKMGTSHPSIVAKCICRNEGQDRMYGTGKRLMNEKQGKMPGYKCTVCGKVHNLTVLQDGRIQKITVLTVK